jgi:prephenate dehydrogenase
MEPKITIIGDGRFGTYLQNQIERTLGTRPFMAGKGQGPSEEATDCNMAIFCVPIRDFEAAWKDYLPHWKSGTAVMDTCSVKIHPCNVMLKNLREDLAIAGTHPLFGPQSAPSFCEGQRLAYIPLRGDCRPILKLWKETLGTIPFFCSMEEHDREMGTQLLNHFIGRAAHRAGVRRVTLSTKTHDLFMDIVNIVQGNSDDLFEDMNRFNPYSKEIRENFLGAATAIHQGLTRKSQMS